MRWIAAILSLLAVSTAGAAELVPTPGADAKFEEIERSIFLYDANPYTIPKAIEKNEVAGLSVVLIHDGKPAVHRTYGYRIKGKEERTTEETVYQCASTSKMVVVARDRHRRKAGRAAARSIPRGVQRRAPGHAADPLAGAVLQGRHGGVAGTDHAAAAPEPHRWPRRP